MTAVIGSTDCPPADLAATRAVIAASIGYTSEYAFSRAFTRARRTPPGRYRTQATSQR